MKFANLIFTLLILINIQSFPQVVKELDNIRNLKLNSINGKIKTYYSDEFDKRAKIIQQKFEKAEEYYKNEFNVKPDLYLLLLNETDWYKAGNKIPYGLPHVSSSGNTSLIYLPADNSYGVVVDVYKNFEDQDLAEAIIKMGISYSDASKMMVDIIGFHELGHSISRSFGMYAFPKWFDEFFASYIAYSFLVNKEPELATVFNEMVKVIKRNITPDKKFATLKAFNKHYIKMGIENYMWHQSNFMDKILPVYKEQENNFIWAVIQFYSDNAKFSEDELVNYMNKIYPEFSKLFRINQ